MNETLSNITTIIAIGSIIITAILAYNTIRESRSEKDKSKTVIDNLKNQTDDYEDILEATRQLEFEREKNKGQHFEDESVYLNRANQIRINSSFFSWVNNYHG